VEKGWWMNPGTAPCDPKRRSYTWMFFGWTPKFPDDILLLDPNSWNQKVPNVPAILSGHKIFS